MNLSDELAVLCVSVKEAEDKAAMPMVGGPQPAPSLGTPALGALNTSTFGKAPLTGGSAATQAIAEANQRVAAGQQAARQQINTHQQQTQQPRKIDPGAVKPIQAANIGVPRARYVPPAQTSKTAADEEADGKDWRQVREQFGSLEQREKLLRRHAQRWEELARTRAGRQEPSAASEFGQRLMPVPHTSGEALVRIPGMVAGGVGGGILGRMAEPADPSEIQRVIAAVRGKGERTRPIQRNLAELVGKGKATRVVKALRAAKPEVAARALRRIDLLPAGKEVAGLREVIDPAFKGVGGRGRLATEIGSLAGQSGKSRLLPKLRPWRLGGALAGAGLAGLATGLPFAIRAMMQRGEGGEAAVRAQQRAKELGELAEQAAKERGALL